MMHQIRRVALVGAFIALGGCLPMEGNAPSTRSFTLEYAPPRIQGLAPLPCVVTVHRFSAAPEYQTSALVYRSAPYRSETYPYCRWRANPADLVSYYLGRDMRESDLFEGVFPSGSVQGASFGVEGAVDQFLEDDGPLRWEAALTLSIALVREDEPDPSRQVIFQKTYKAREPCRKKSPEALAEAMSRAMAKLSAAIIKDLYHHLAEINPKGRGAVKSQAGDPRRAQEEIRP